MPTRFRWGATRSSIWKWPATSPSASTIATANTSYCPRPRLRITWPRCRVPMAKMSKSYDNTIPVWLSGKKLRRAIMRIRTNSQEPGEPKDPDTAPVFDVYAAFASEEQRLEMREEFARGIAWGEVKQRLFELVDGELAEARERYEALMANPQQVEEELLRGAEKARAISAPFIEKLRHAVGIRALS